VNYKKISCEIFWNVLIIHSIGSFSLSISKNDNCHEEITAIILSLIFTRSNIHRLELNIHSSQIKRMIWCKKYTIEYLIIGTLIDFHQICSILSCLSRLWTLVLKSFSIEYGEKNLLAYPLLIRQNILDCVQYLCAYFLWIMNLNQRKYHFQHFSVYLAIIIHQ